MATRPAPTLPTPATALIGRATELAELGFLLSDGHVRLLTLVGPPGVGKTRLGLQVAADHAGAYAHGARLVSLASVDDAELVIPTLAAALGLAPPGGDARAALEAHLRDRHMLIVLDDFERVLDAAGDLASLLQAAPRLTLLVTSRVTLRLSAEYTYRVQPLTLPSSDEASRVDGLRESPAVALFVDRARAVRSDFELTEENAPIVAQICRRLDGLPLAIELAAVRIKLLGPRALLARLTDRLGPLGRGAQDRPDRQKTLRAALEWSYDLLHPAEQRLFAALGVFAGGCTLAAAAAVWVDAAAPSGVEGGVGGAADADGSGGAERGAGVGHRGPAVGEQAGAPEEGLLDRLETLVDHSLLQAEIGQTGEPRFSMLPIVREYALARLRRDGRHDALGRRHAEYYTSLAGTWRAAGAGTGAGGGAADGDAAAESDNFQVALAWALAAADAELGLALASALWRHWQLRGRLAYGRKWLDALLALPGVEGPARADALFGAGVLARYQGDLPASHRLLGEAEPLWRRLGDAHGLAETLTHLGRADDYVGDFDAARAHLDEALAYWRRAGDDEGLASALAVRAGLANHQGDVATAESMRRESLELWRALGDREGVGRALLGLGEVARCRGDLEGARRHCMDALATFRELGDPYHQGSTLHNLGYIELHRGDTEAARASFLASMELMERVGHRIAVASCMVGLAGVCLDAGAGDSAARLLATAEHGQREIGTNLVRADAEDWDDVRAGIRAAIGADALERIEREAGPLSTAEVLRIVNDAVAGSPAGAVAGEPAGAVTPEPAGAQAGYASPAGVTVDVPPEVPGDVAAGVVPGAAPEFTDREVDVLRLLADGLTYAQIGERLFISARTVDAHLRSIYPKLDVHSRHAAVRAARRLQLI